MSASRNVLFLCTANSARSILAEGLFNSLAGAGWKAYSAGSHPKGEVHPLALATLQALGLPAEGYRSKSRRSLPSLARTPPDRPLGRGRPGRLRRGRDRAAQGLP